jgi:hypothetical protein
MAEATSKSTPEHDADSFLDSESDTESDVVETTDAVADVVADAAADAGADEEPSVPPQLKVYAHGDDLLAVQSAAPAYVKPTDPLVLVLDASSSNRKLDLSVLGEALTRLFKFLAKTQRRVSILVFHSEVIVLHPAEERMFPLMNCVMEAAAPVLRVTEHMTASISELQTALNLPITEKNVDFLVKSYVNVVKAGGSKTVHHTWITSTLRLAASILRHVATRTEHSQILLVCDGGEFYGRDAAGRQGYLEAAGIAKKLVPAFGTLLCTVSVSCLALGPDAELDTLSAIAYTLDGMLAYVKDAKDVGTALADLMRFLARRPTQLLVRDGSGSLPETLVAPFPDDVVMEARKAYTLVRAIQLFGEDGDATRVGWLASLPSGCLQVLPRSSTATQLCEGGEEEGTLHADVVPPHVTQALRMSECARTVARLLYPLMSWRSKVVAAADTPALTHALADVLETIRTTGLPRYAFATLHALVEARTAGVKDKHQERVTYVRMLALAHPFMANLTVKPAHMAALESLPVDSTVADARAAFEREHVRWVSANPERAARYACALLGDAQEMPCLPSVKSVCDSGAGAGSACGSSILWAPFASASVPSPVNASTGESPDPILTAPLVHPTPLLVGLQTYAVVAQNGCWAAEDIEVRDDGGAFVVEGQEVPADSRRGRELRALLRAPHVPALNTAGLPLPLFLQLEDAMNPFTSMAASKALAAIVHGTEDAWQDPLLPSRVYGSLVGRWLHAAACKAAGMSVASASAWGLDAQLVADICRTLAITAEVHLVSDMYARFVRGAPSKTELTQAKAALDAALACRDSSDEDSSSEDSSSEDSSSWEEKERDARAVLAAYESRMAWRGEEVVQDVPALSAILALYRNPQEYVRAKQAAVKAYVDNTVKRRAINETLSFDAEVERRLASSLEARRRKGLPQPSAAKRAYYRKLIRRALKEERDAEAAELDGAKLDEEERKAARTREIVESMPPDLSVTAYLAPDKYKIGDFVDTAVPVIEAELVRRGEAPAYAAALASKLTDLYSIGDALVQTVPADAAILSVIARVFEL